MIESMAVCNISTYVSDEEVRHWVAAIQANMEAFCKAWSLTPCALGVVPRDVGTRLRPEGMAMQIVADQPHQAAAMGFHELAASGAPIGYTFAEADLTRRTSMSCTLSHEIWEMLVDPKLDRMVSAYDKDWAVEVSDPVEADRFGWMHVMPTGPAVLISNYCLPSYFNLDGPPFDAGWILDQPLPALAPDGYLAYRDAEGFWGQINRFDSVRARANAKPPQLSRRYRRVWRDWDKTEIQEAP